MKVKDSNDYFNLNNVEIEYNDDFDTNKTKSLIKFPNKNNEFILDNSSKNFSKSLKFNSRQCYAPKIKFKKCLKKPSPIFFKKIANKHTMKTQCDVISEELLSEKESSLLSDSSSSDYILDNKEENKEDDNDISGENKNENEIKMDMEKKHIDDLIGIYKQDKEFQSDMKIYEHRSIGVFPYQSCKNISNKNCLKIYRNNLHRIKMKLTQPKNKEQEFILKNAIKKKYRLDLVTNNKKANLNNEYTIIPINSNEKSNSDEDSDDMKKLRNTISYNQSKLKKEKEKDSQKIVNIYEVLRKSVK